MPTAVAMPFRQRRDRNLALLYQDHEGSCRHLAHRKPERHIFLYAFPVFRFWETK